MLNVTHSLKFVFLAQKVKRLDPKRNNIFMLLVIERIYAFILVLKHKAPITTTTATSTVINASRHKSCEFLTVIHANRLSTHWWLGL